MLLKVGVVKGMVYPRVERLVVGHHLATALEAAERNVMQLTRPDPGLGGAFSWVVLNISSSSASWLQHPLL